MRLFHRPTFNQGEQIVFNARKEAGLQDPETWHLMELDVYLPRLNLAFEYQVYSLIIMVGLTMSPERNNTIIQVQGEPRSPWRASKEGTLGRSN